MVKSYKSVQKFTVADCRSNNAAIRKPGMNKSTVPTIILRTSQSENMLCVNEIFIIEYPHMREKLTVNLNVNGQNIVFDHDSGAAFSLMNYEQAKARFKGAAM